MNYFDIIQEASTYIKDQGVNSPKIGLIFGSGLGELADSIENKIAIPYSDIPNFPVSTVKGHSGQLVYGNLRGQKVIALQGRFHYYEGYSMKEVTLPVRVFQALGVESLIVTNAAGGVDPDFNPGDLMLITDHINFMGDNPLIGPNDDRLGERFPDVTNAYDPVYLDLAREVAKEMDIELQEGVYTGFTGPVYETPAEIKMAQIMGGSAAGMSTVPEVTAAHHGGIRVLGISCITNHAAGLGPKLSHEEVIEVSARVRDSFKQLILTLIERL